MLKETKELIEEARKNAKENPVDINTVKGFRKKGICPPCPARKKRDVPSKPEPEKKILAKQRNFYKRAFVTGYGNLVALGLELAVIERLFGVSYQYLSKQFEVDEEIQQSYLEAMDKLQNFLACQILVKGIGYDYTEEKTVYCKQGITIGKVEDGQEKANYNPRTKAKKGKWKEYRKEVFKKHQAGDTQALIFFMTNRFPDKWKVSRELLTGKAENYDSNPSERTRKAIESLARDVLEKDTNRPETEHPVQDGLARLSGTSE